ncbi:hypothetical protein GCM10027093_15240 [Paraburkholderia jirisanensis]
MSPTTQTLPPAAAEVRVAHALPQPAPNTDGIWYASYPPGVPHEIDVAQYASLTQFFDECTQKYRERVAYVSAGSNLTYGELARKANAFGSWLQSIGVKPGERVAIMLPNTFQYPVALFGALKAGAVVVNVNPLYTVRELAHQLKDSGAQTIVVFENFAKTVEDALPGTRIQNVVISALGDLLEDGLNLKGRLINFMLRHVKKLVPAYGLPQAVRMLDALAAGYRRPLVPVALNQTDVAFLQYTGGTTGVAKGAMLTHRNIIANLLQAKVWSESQLSGDVETILTPLPLYHIYSLTVNAFIFMLLGGRNILIANPRDMKRVMSILRHENFHRHHGGQYAVQRISRQRGVLQARFLEAEARDGRRHGDAEGSRRTLQGRDRQAGHRGLRPHRMFADRVNESGRPEAHARVRWLDRAAGAVHPGALSQG